MSAALKQFLFARMYRHPRVMASMDKAKTVVAELFAALSHDPVAAAAGLGGGVRARRAMRRPAGSCATTSRA